MAILNIPAGTKLLVQHKASTIAGNTEIPEESQLLFIPPSRANNFMTLLPQRGTSFEAFRPNITYSTDSATGEISMYLTETSYQELQNIVTPDHMNEVEVGIILARHHRSKNRKNGKKYLNIARQEDTHNKTKSKLIKGASIMWKGCHICPSSRVYPEGVTYDATFFISPDSTKLPSSTRAIETGHFITDSNKVFKYIHPIDSTMKDSSRSGTPDDMKHKFYFFGLILRIPTADKKSYIESSFSKYSIRIWSQYTPEGQFKSIKAAMHNGYYGRRTTENKLPISLD